MKSQLIIFLAAMFGIASAVPGEARECPVLYFGYRDGPDGCAREHAFGVSANSPQILLTIQCTEPTVYGSVVKLTGEFSVLKDGYTRRISELIRSRQEEQENVPPNASDLQKKFQAPEIVAVKQNMLNTAFKELMSMLRQDTSREAAQIRRALSMGLAPVRIYTKRVFEISLIPGRADMKVLVHTPDMIRYALTSKSKYTPLQREINGINAVIMPAIEEATQSLARNGLW